MRLQRRLLAVSLATLFASLACATLTNLAQQLPLIGATATPVPTAIAVSPEDQQRQQEILEAIAAAVREQYVREDLDGVDWEAAVQQARQKIEGGVSEEGFAQAMRDLTAALPRGNADYETRAERIEAETRATDTYQGIGVYFGFRETPEARVIVLSVIQDSPAQAAGLLPHDSIYAVDGEPIKAEERRTIQNRIRGLADSPVTLTVQTPGQQRREVTITRGQITSGDPLRGGLLGTSGLLYYRIPVAAPSDMADLIAQDLTEKANAQTLSGVILDLRVASSNVNWPLEQMLALFGDGPLGAVYTRQASQPLEVLGVDAGGSQDLPLVILIGPDTRGVPEVFASFLQAAGRATLLGLPTPGEIDILSSIALPDGSRLALATTSFKLPDGADPALTGVSPDQRVDSDWDTHDEDTDPARDAAIEALSK